MEEEHPLPLRHADGTFPRMAFAHRAVAAGRQEGARPQVKMTQLKYGCGLLFLFSL